MREQLAREGETEQHQTFPVQPPRLVQDPFPSHVASGPDQFGKVTDPTQRPPAMARAVAQRIRSRSSTEKVGTFLPCEGDGRKPVPESIQVERECVIAKREPDMELDEDALAAHQGQFPQRLDVGGLLGRGSGKN